MHFLCCLYHHECVCYAIRMHTHTHTQTYTHTHVHIVTLNPQIKGIQEDKYAMYNLNFITFCKGEPKLQLNGLWVIVLDVWSNNEFTILYRKTTKCTLQMHPGHFYQCKHSLDVDEVPLFVLYKLWLRLIMRNILMPTIMNLSLATGSTHYYGFSILVILQVGKHCKRRTYQYREN